MTYIEWCESLDTKEGDKELYRLTRPQDWAGKDVHQVRVIKGQNGNVLTSEQNIFEKMGEYFEELMNEKNEREEDEWKTVSESGSALAK